MTGSVPLGGRTGGGGGGSRGLLFFKGSTVPANTVNTITGGANGILRKMPVVHGSYSISKWISVSKSQYPH